jgi:signal peptidase I
MLQNSNSPLPNQQDCTEPTAKQDHLPAPTDAGAEGAPKKRKSFASVVADNAMTLAWAVLLALGVRTFVAEPRYIPTSSMEPTLQIDDRLIIDKVSFLFRKPQRGEIVVFYPPESPVVPDPSKVYIKRVIGLPGDRLAIKGGKVYVNGKVLPENYIAEPANYELPSEQPTVCPPICLPSLKLVRENNIVSFTVPDNHYWVMGDNRNNSADSHVWGFLPGDRLVGRALFRYWPLNRFGGF